MQIDKNISIGNIVSWLMIVIAFTMGFAKIKSATEQNAKDVLQARDLAERVDKSQRDIDALRAAQINALTVSAAKTEITVLFIDKKIDELIKHSNNKP